MCASHCVCVLICLALLLLHDGEELDFLVAAGKPEKNKEKTKLLLGGKNSKKQIPLYGSQRLDYLETKEEKK